MRAAQGCHDAALHYGAPFVSGKDSLNNEYVDPTGQKTPIPPTLLISALGFVPDVRRAVTMDLKEAGSRLYILGKTRAELGGAISGQGGGRAGGCQQCGIRGIDEPADYVGDLRVPRLTQGRCSRRSPLL